MTPLFNFVFLVACALLIDNSATVEYTRLVFEKCIELKMNNSNWNGIIVILISNSTWVNPVKKIDNFLIAAPELKWPNTKRMNQFSLVQTLKSWKCDWDWEPAIYIGYDNEIKMEMPNYWYRCARCHSQKEPLHSHFDDFFFASTWKQKKSHFYYNYMMRIMKSPPISSNFTCEQFLPSSSCASSDLLSQKILMQSLEIFIASNSKFRIYFPSPSNVVLSENLSFRVVLP